MPRETLNKNSATVTKGSAAVVKALPLIFLKVSAHMGSTHSASKLLSSPSVDDVLDTNLPFSFTTCWRCAFLAHVALATESPFVSRKMCCVAPELLRTNCFEKTSYKLIINADKLRSEPQLCTHLHQHTACADGSASASVAPVEEVQSPGLRR